MHERWPASWRWTSLALADRAGHSRTTGLENGLKFLPGTPPHEVMTSGSTTIWEAARDRLAQWTPTVRSKEGSRSLPGSHRFTDQDIWPAPTAFGQADKSQCGSAQETARISREDVSRFHRCQTHLPSPAASQHPPPPPWLTFLCAIPQWVSRGETQYALTKQRKAALRRRKERTKSQAASTYLTTLI